MDYRRCVITNIASFYRHAIYKLMSEELSFDFFCGTTLNTKDPIPILSFLDFKTKTQISKNIYIAHSNFYWQRKALTLLKQYDLFVILGDPYCISTWIICIINKLLHKKIIFWTHGMYGNESLLKRKIKCFFFSLADIILVYGDYAINLMRKEGIATSKMYPIHNSLDF